MKTTIKKLNEVDANEIKTIFNASYRKRDKVSQFGQEIDNPNIHNANREDLIDTLEVLIDLYDESINTYDVTGLNMYQLEDTNFAYLDEFEISCNNTYNWSAPLTNDLDFRVYKVEHKMFIQVNVQSGYGDVRGGYMIGFLYEFDICESSADWTLIFGDLNSHYKSFTINEVTFDFSLLSESGVYNVYSESYDIDDCDIYIGDYEDCVKYVNDLKEQTNED